MRHGKMISVLVERSLEFWQLYFCLYFVFSKDRIVVFPAFQSLVLLFGDASIPKDTSIYNSVWFGFRVRVLISLNLPKINMFRLRQEVKCRPSTSVLLVLF